MSFRPTLLLSAMLASLFLLSACSDTSVPVAPDADDVAKRQPSSRLNPDWLGEGLPPEAVPGTPDELVASYRLAHDQRDPELLDLLLNADFRFVKLDGQAWDRVADYSIMTKMMVGRAGINGLTIADMSVDFFIPMGVWTPVPSNDPYFGGVDSASSRAYDVRISYELAGQQLVLQVRGVVVFYVVPRGGMYQLLGLVDLTNGRTEDTSWTAIKSLFE